MLKIGEEYVLNEDIKGFINLKEGVNPSSIKAGTKVKLIEINGEYVTINHNGISIVTEDHMLA